jgi:hypothetical protein
MQKDKKTFVQSIYDMTELIELGNNSTQNMQTLCFHVIQISHEYVAYVMTLSVAWSINIKLYDKFRN